MGVYVDVLEMFLGIDIGWVLKESDGMVWIVVGCGYGDCV